MTIPTLASTCAGFTNVVYLYNDDGEFIQEERLGTCPDLTVLDYKITGLAPSRFLAAGMGAAYSTAFEFSLSREDLELNQPRQIAFTLANHIQEVLMGKGDRALADVKRGEVTSTVESVLEVNILETGLVSCLGGRAFRSMLAHHLAHQLLPYAGEEILFGDLVAFGVIVQEQIRGTSPEELGDLFEFYGEVGLPMSLDSLGLPENQRENILGDAADNVKTQLSDRDLPFSFEVEDLVQGVRKADELGQTVIQSGPGAIE